MIRKDAETNQLPLTKEKNPLLRRVMQINELLSDAIGYNISDDTLPEIEIFSPKKESLLRRISAALSGITKGAGADRASRKISLKDDATDREIAHELVHIIHWDIQDEKGSPTVEEEGEKALVMQAWEEGVAVFGELEFWAYELMKKNNRQAKSNEINQKRLNFFPKYCKTGQEYQSSKDEFLKLVEAVKRFQKVSKGASEKKLSQDVSVSQTAKDVKTIASNKIYIYDVGYKFVVDAVTLLMKIRSIDCHTALDIVMRNSPNTTDELIDASSYLTRVLTTQP